LSLTFFKKSTRGRGGGPISKKKGLRTVGQEKIRRGKGVKREGGNSFYGGGLNGRGNQGVPRSLDGDRKEGGGRGEFYGAAVIPIGKGK